MRRAQTLPLGVILPEARRSNQWISVLPFPPPDGFFNSARTLPGVDCPSI